MGDRSGTAEHFSGRAKVYLYCNLLCSRAHAADGVDKTPQWMQIRKTSKQNHRDQMRRARSGCTEQRNGDSKQISSLSILFERSTSHSVHGQMEHRKSSLNIHAWMQGLGIRHTDGARWWQMGFLLRERQRSPSPSPEDPSPSPGVLKRGLGGVEEPARAAWDFTFIQES